MSYKLRTKFDFLTKMCIIYLYLYFSILLYHIFEKKSNFVRSINKKRNPLHVGEGVSVSNMEGSAQCTPRGITPRR